VCGGSNERLEYRWSSEGSGLSGADHRLIVVCPASTDPARFVDASPEDGPPLERARGWPVEWTVETYPAILRPGTPEGRRLGVQQICPGLVLAESGLDADGVPVIKHQVTLRADDAVSPAMLDRLSLLG